MEADKSRKSCTMIITEPNKFVTEVNDRMPVRCWSILQGYLSLCLAHAAFV
jgi:hypothetical protein